MTVFVGLSVKIERKEEAAGAVPPTPSPHLRDSCPTVVTSVLEHRSKQACWRRSLHC